jgi:hypothetical protein
MHFLIFPLVVDVNAMDMHHAVCGVLMVKWSANVNTILRVETVKNANYFILIDRGHEPRHVTQMSAKVS